MTPDLQIAELRRELCSCNPALRLAAAEKLLTHPAAARPLAADLLKLCACCDDALRETIVGVLEDLGPPPSDVLFAVVPFLEGQELQAYWAATLLGRLGKCAHPAVPALAAALAHSNLVPVRERCAWALGRIGAAASPALPVLQAAAHSDYPRLARLAKEALAAIGQT